MGKENLNVFSQQVGIQENRKLNFIKENKRSVWAGLGVFGMVGWSVVVPALAGAALGIWMDKNYPQSFSWTLTWMIFGIVAGCLIAWQWIDKEDKDMHQNKNNKQ